jgi:glycosyltransferase involved in cell wall biosynthesis
VNKVEPSPRISLIVCTTGRRDRLDTLFERLSRVLNESAPLVEVVVVDNSREGDLVLADPRVRVVRCSLPGLSRARTAGCIQAHGDVLVFTDDDVEFDANWPERIAQPVLEGRLDVAAAPVRLGHEFDSIASALLRQWLAEANLDGESRLVGAGMALHRRLLGYGAWDPRIGAGNPDFAFGEETLFESMITNAGARIGVVQDASVVHHPDQDRISPDYWRRTAEQKGRSGAYVAYHWSGETMPRATLRTWRRRLRLRLHRSASGTPSEFELRLIESWARADSFRLLQSEPRAYFPHSTARLPAPGSQGAHPLPSNTESSSDPAF